MPGELVHPKKQLRQSAWDHTTDAMSRLRAYMWGSPEQQQAETTVTPEQKQQLQDAAQAPPESLNESDSAEDKDESNDSKGKKEQKESSVKQAYSMAPPSTGGNTGVSQRQMRAQLERVRQRNPQLARQLAQFMVGSVPVAGPPAAGVTGMLQSPSGSSSGLLSFLGSGAGQVAGGMAGVGLGDMMSKGTGGNIGRILSMLGGGLLGTSVGGGLGSAMGFNQGMRSPKTASFQKGYKSVIDRID